LALDISKNNSHYSVNVIFQELRYEQLFELPYYSRKWLQLNDWDCDDLQQSQMSRAPLDGGPPGLFIAEVAPEKLPSKVQAELLALQVLKDGKPIGAYQDPSIKGGVDFAAGIQPTK